MLSCQKRRLWQGNTGLLSASEKRRNQRPECCDLHTWPGHVADAKLLSYGEETKAVSPLDVVICRWPSNSRTF